MTDTDLLDPERRLSIAYAPRDRRPALETLWTLDAQLGRVVASTTEGMVGRIRLAWWREALERLDTAPAPAEPVLTAAALHLLPQGTTGATLAGLAEGWDALLEPMDDAVVALHATARGGRLFAIAAEVLGGQADARVRTAGEAWALADLAFHLRDRAVAQRALDAARERFAEPRAWPRALRPLGLLTVLAADDAARGLDAERRRGSPRRMLRGLRLALTGR